MDIATLAQIVTAVTNLLFVVVLAGGYYFTWRVSQRTLEEMRAQRASMGRPLVIVEEDFDSLPELDLAIRNVSQGAAKDITFEFSAPIENSGGFVISDMPYFKNGLDFLPPNGEINCYWDEIDSLLPFLEQKSLQNGIYVTAHYKDLTGVAYESRWKLNPFLYKDTRIVKRKGMGDLVKAVEKLAAKQQTTAPDGQTLDQRPGPRTEPRFPQQKERARHKRRTRSSGLKNVEILADHLHVDHAASRGSKTDSLGGGLREV